MQPTLYGVVVTNLLSNTNNVAVPPLLTQIYEGCVHGNFYHDIVAEADGEVVDVPKLKGLGISIQPVVVKYAGEAAPKTINIWFAPELNMPGRDQRGELGLYPLRKFKKGESIARFKDFAGDHLFVDRISYNFRHPKRGDIVVFKTFGIPRLNQDQFYIKRLIGLPGEQIYIGADRHTVIDGKRLDASTPPFENVYGFDPKTQPRDSQYSGHIPVWRFEGGQTNTVEAMHYLVFGDNTVSSWDSRGWGDVPQENVIGQYCFVYWPISTRFGWSQH
jgi:signal peptidase I